MSSPAARLLQRLSSPVDIASLAVFRIGFGLLLAYQAIDYLTSGRIERQYTSPTVHFPLPGFERFHPLPDPQFRLLFVALAAAGLMIAAGFLHRLAAVVYTVGYGYTLVLETAAYNNHVYLIVLLTLLAAWLPLHRALSLDAFLRPALRAQTVPAWTLWMLRLQIGAPYFFGGIAKINRDWLVRAEPMRTWLLHDIVLPGMPFLRRPWAPMAISWAGLLLDLFAVPLLVWRRSRPLMAGALVLFHLANSQLFVIGVFPWLMIWAVLLYFPPDWPRRIGLMMPASAAPARRERIVHARGLQLAAAATWMLVQVVVPFRHFLHPGNVDWTEESHRFSWRMKIRDKRGPLTFVARDPVTGLVEPLPDAMGELAPFQQAMIVHDPEMLRQFAVHLQSELAAAGRPRTEIRVESAISFNGRPPQPFIDPSVDLSRVPPGTPRARWLATVDPAP